MKKNNNTKGSRVLVFALLSISALLIAGCCRSTNCDPCIDPYIEFDFSNTGSYCNDSVYHYRSVRTYDSTWNQHGDGFINNNCEAWAFARNLPLHYVFYLDTSIVDTITLVSYTPLPTDDKGCCQCPGLVADFRYVYKGTGHKVTGDILQMPF